ncbi:tRNA (guanosine(37)-N1)-methyltransferase TrmD [Paenibacillus physcomitrellae]|uniref:tRNA (guanine-N(1)-)-methyltransferase n=1 Tax=Paenibacillus physcomitrellae TaxID=1619311 RepID=A0ABQ1GAJ2_9BACL|nr:tRNA (guanosine(37)-N1)-methyltransferase TrmD [Paenibacillus physcomitrellae]GGA39936.1 tRNA (guanine-N(1)-)-methyltransferase [Paenibacillus physcomitrellae]
MRVDVLTLFPEMFTGVFGSSILGKAQEKGLVSLKAINFRDYSESKHGTVDDTPYGGGGGMVLKPEPIFRAVEALLNEQAAHSSQGEPGQCLSGPKRPPRVILLCPQGESFTQAKAEELAREDHLIMICGHYEGYDERIREHLVTDEISVGDYVLTGGELPAMVVTDSVVRLLPGVLGNETSAVTDSFSTGLLEYPHYTRPVEYQGWKVPDILLSGHHSNIEAWRRKEALRRTWERRPDLLDKLELTKQDKQWLAEIQTAEGQKPKA